MKAGRPCFVSRIGFHTTLQSQDGVGKSLQQTDSFPCIYYTHICIHMCTDIMHRHSSIEAPTFEKQKSQIPWEAGECGGNSRLVRKGLVEGM